MTRAPAGVAGAFSCDDGGHYRMPLFPFAAPRLPGSWLGKANSPKKSQVKKGGSNPSRQGGFGLTKAYLGAGPQASKSSKKPGNPAIPARMPVDRSFHKPLFIHQNRPSRRPAGDIDRLRRNMRIRRHWGIRQAVLFEGAGFLERQHWRGRRTSGHCSLRQCAARSWLIPLLAKSACRIAWQPSLAGSSRPVPQRNRHV